MIRSLEKPKRETSADYVSYIKGLPCLLLTYRDTRCEGPIDPHHVRPRSLGGSDLTCVPLCRKHRDEANNRRQFEAKYHLDFDWEIRLLFQNYTRVKVRIRREPRQRATVKILHCASCKRDHEFPYSKVLTGTFRCPTTRELVQIGA